MFFLLIELFFWYLYLNVCLWFNDLVPQPEEQRTRVHKENSSVCETVRTEEKELENDDSVTVNIPASGIVFLDILYFI